MFCKIGIKILNEYLIQKNEINVNVMDCLQKMTAQKCPESL